MLRRFVAWVMLVGATVGFATNMSLWLLGVISERTMLGVTLAVTWLSLMFAAFNAVQIAHDAD